MHIFGEYYMDLLGPTEMYRIFVCINNADGCWYTGADLSECSSQSQRQALFASLPMNIKSTLILCC
jgi:hypothetical protein